MRNPTVRIHGMQQSCDTTIRGQLKFNHKDLSLSLAGLYMSTCHFENMFRVLVASSYLPKEESFVRKS